MWGSFSPFTLLQSGLWWGFSPTTLTLRLLHAIISLLVRNLNKQPWNRRLPLVTWLITSKVRQDARECLPWYFLSPIAAILALVCVLCAARILLVIWRNIKKPIYKVASIEVMSPLEIAQKQRTIFKWDKRKCVFDKPFKAVLLLCEK